MRRWYACHVVASRWGDHRSILTAAGSRHADFESRKQMIFDGNESSWSRTRLARTMIWAFAGVEAAFALNSPAGDNPDPLAAVVATLRSLLTQSDAR